MKPIIDLKWAQTLDGQLCDDDHKSKWISSKEERTFTHQLRAQYDGVLVGAGTFINDLPKLNVRAVSIKPETQPTRIILDPLGRVDAEILKGGPRGKVLQAINAKDVKHSVLLAPNLSYKSIKALSENHKFEHISFGSTFESENFSEKLLKALSSFSKVMVEGGPRTLMHFIRLGLFEKIIVSISPQITGGTKHRIYTLNQLVNSHKYSVSSTHKKGNDIVLTLKQETYHEAI